MGWNHQLDSNFFGVVLIVFWGSPFLREWENEAMHGYDGDEASIILH